VSQILYPDSIANEMTVVAVLLFIICCWWTAAVQAETSSQINPLIHEGPGRKLSETSSHPFHSNDCLNFLTAEISSLRLPVSDIYIIISVYNIKDQSLLAQSVRFSFICVFLSYLCLR
jgi:hypothetical protein